MIKDSIRRPTCAATINGIRAPLTSFEVESNNHFAADTWECSLALGSLPPGLGLDFWANQAPITVQIFAGLDSDPTTSLILGDADHATLDAATGEVRLSGRDKTALFLEARTTDKFPDHSASDIVTQFANNHSMQAQVTAIQSRVGQQDQQEYAKLTSEQTEWSILTYLAENAGFDLFVVGNTLYFQPPNSSNEQPYVVTYVPSKTGKMAYGSVVTLQCQRSLALASDVAVQVTSWNARLGQIITGQAHASKNGSESGAVQTYNFREPGLNQEQAQKLAQRKLLEICKQERTICWTEPANLALTPRTQVRLQGTGTAWDQLYVIDRIQRRMSFSGGFTMSVQATASSSPSNST
jgi:phage protein D